MYSNTPQKKLIVLSAPSGSGKSTLTRYLVGCEELHLKFSVSATSRTPRKGEVEGTDYYFLSLENFKKRISKNDFLEYEEVYSDHFYGTLRSEVDRIWNGDHHVVFDTDVVGGLSIKGLFPSQTLTVFVKPPSISELRRRLEKRGVDSPEKINMRIKKAEEELQRTTEFDVILDNDDLNTAKKEIYKVVSVFLKS